MNNKHTYITTTLPYVNAKPHIGFALEIVQADIFARFRKLLGDEIFFNFGTDEHGQKIYEKAKEEGKDPQVYVDEYAASFDELKSILNLSYNNFIRTTDSHHKMAAQSFWLKCFGKGDIYKKNYKIKYCVGCELPKQESEIEGGRCPIHPNKDLELREEENYFFRFSKYQNDLLDFYKDNPDFVIPGQRFNEIKSFVAGGLEDFSISRLRSKMPWGVPVPNDQDHVMYVWFDALVNYISAIGWPDDMDKFEKWWPVIQFAGKDNLRQQSAMWQAMLLSADISLSKQIVIHGFVTSGGQKMSKSLGNVISPFDLVKEYGTDAVRYYLFREMTPFEDSDITDEKFKKAYNSNLANGLGNLVSRVIKMAETNLEKPVPVGNLVFPDNFVSHLNKYEFNLAADLVWQKIADADQMIQETRPFSVVKDDRVKGQEIITLLVNKLAEIAGLLAPFMPSTSEKIFEAIKNNHLSETLFVRK